MPAKRKRRSTEYVQRDRCQSRDSTRPYWNHHSKSPVTGSFVRCRFQIIEDMPVPKILPPLGMLHSHRTKACPSTMIRFSLENHLCRQFRLPPERCQRVGVV